jgi:hypothetical protein
LSIGESQCHVLEAVIALTSQPSGDHPSVLRIERRTQGDSAGAGWFTATWPPALAARFTSTQPALANGVAEAQAT